MKPKPRKPRAPRKPSMSAPRFEHEIDRDDEHEPCIHCGLCDPHGDEMKWECPVRLRAALGAATAELVACDHLREDILHTRADLAEVVAERDTAIASLATARMDTIEECILDVKAYNDFLRQRFVTDGWPADHEAIVALRKLIERFRSLQQPAPGDVYPQDVHELAVARRTVEPTRIRTPRGTIDNCALANGAVESECQICGGTCPDRKPAPGETT